MVLTCSTEAIIPAWSSLLLTIELQPYAKKTITRDLEALEISICQDIINNLDVETYKDKPLIIKGYAQKPVPSNAYIMLSSKLKPVAKSIM